jgi:adenosylhomocysteine nucleosidase
MGGVPLSQSDARKFKNRGLGDVKRHSSFSARIGIVTGLFSEATIARKLTESVLCAGGRPEVAAGHARRLIQGGATSLMSFGIAGGLRDDLAPGTLVVADRVVTANGEYRANPAVAKALRAMVGCIYGGEAIVARSDAKAALAARTGALAVDLESGPVALLPLDLRGRPRLGAVFGSILRHPGQIAGLIATARDTGAALQALEKARRILNR